MSGMKPKERLLSHAFTSLCLGLCTQLSYRKSAALINTVLHRCDSNYVKTRTLADFAESYGNRIDAYLKSTTNKILEHHHFEVQADRVVGETPETEAPAFCNNSDDRNEIDSKMASIREKVAAINDGREPAAQILVDARLADMEIVSNGCCNISIDDIGVKQQKTKRKDGGAKDGKYVENTVIHVQADGQCYILTAIGLDNAFRMLMAFLLENRLIGHRLVFYADGAQSIKCYIEKYFASFRYTLILDWYHLKKKCKELISSSFKGTIDQKKELSRDLLRILWVGNTDGAIDFLKNLPQSTVKNEHWLQELVGYLDRKKSQIVCYALRHSFNLRISSNRVEKANDLLVAERQKHNGMSWSACGSGALAAISMVFHNGETEKWLRSSSLVFALRLDIAA
jgi:hypothetical protein